MNYSRVCVVNSLASMCIEKQLGQEIGMNATAFPESEERLVTNAGEIDRLLRCGSDSRPSRGGEDTTSNENRSDLD